MNVLIGIIGGLGLFLFGMHNMSEGLKQAAGERLKRLLEALTTNKLSGVITGTVVTALVQSSSATTVMVVGLVNARIMSLHQAVGVIMGANIGTTVTAQLIAFQIEEIALPAAGLGVFLYMFSKKERLRFLGQVVLGFGLLFLGLEVMKDALRPLRELEAFRQLLISFGQNPLLGVLAGTAITVAVQSSSASIGLLQSLAAEGLVPLRSALPILFGDNIGTTITAALSAIGASIAAKRAAAVHVVFNVVGTLIFLPLLPVVATVVSATSGDVVRQIANAHTLFNVTNTIIQLPLAGAIVWLVMRMLPGEEVPTVEPGTEYQFDRRLIATPSLALNLMRKETLEMARSARRMVALSVDALITGEPEDLGQIFAMEEEINRTTEAISAYLTDVGRRKLSREETRISRALFHIIADVERVGDHGENIAELAEYRREKQVVFSEKAAAELRELSSTALAAFDLALEAWTEQDEEKARRVFELERRVDVLEKAARDAHIERLNLGECHPAAGIAFLDAASNLERIADHAAGIAAQVVEES